MSNPERQSSSDDEFILDTHDSPQGPKFPLLNVPDDTKLPSNPQIGSFLESVPLLNDFNQDECGLIGGQMQMKKFLIGQPIIKQGEPGMGMYILETGSAKVTRTEGEGKHAVEIDLDTISPGDYFGEGALVSQAPRGASVIATSDCSALFLSRDHYNSLFQKDGKSTLTFAKRGVIRVQQSKNDEASSVYEMRVPVNPVTQKDDKIQKMLYETLKDQVLFTGMENEHKLRAISSMWKVTVPKDTILIRQGDIGDNFYVMETGKVAVYIKSADGKTLRKVDSMSKPGKSFGELALLYNTPRNATIKAKSKSTLWVLDRLTFRRLMRNVTEERLKSYQDFLSSVPLFQPLSNNERSRIAEAIESAQYRDGENIVREGDRGDTMFIITDGIVQVSKLVDDKQCVLNNLKKGDFFGERSLLEGEVRTATVTCIGRVEVAKVDLYAFKLLLGPVHDVLIQRAKESQQRDNTANQTKSDLVHLSENAIAQAKLRRVILANQNPDLQPQDLEVIGFLGKGGYGYVELVKHLKSGATFALKTLYRSHIIRTKSMTNVLNEKRMLTQMDSPHIIRLFATFKDDQKLQFLLEPCLGGELFTLLRARGNFAEKAARFYAASVILALEEIHNNGVVYRDLKPENLLLDNEGFIKVTDFGLSKIIGDSRTFTVCGTPHYLAPEIIQGTGHGKSVDLWCLGVLIYEMLAGRPPFYRPGERGDHMRLYRRITCCDYQPSSMFSEDSWDLIQRLLQFKPSLRINHARLKKHPWFAGIDWHALQTRSNIRAPIIPYIRTSEDLTNFKKAPPSLQLPANDPSLANIDQSWDAEF